MPFARLNFLVLLFSMNTLANTQIPSEHIEKAESITGTVNQRFGQADTISSEAIHPLTSNQQMKTLDGKQSFNVSLMCAESVTFAELLTAPASNGNLRFINITQDTNLDGTLDTVTQMNGLEASAICSNGFMYCSNPLDASTCKSYQYSTHSDSNYRLTYEQTALSKLGGCYCINNACGGNVTFGNINAILSDVAGGIAAALSQRNTFFTLTDTEINGTAIKLKGADSASCQINSAESTLGQEDVQKIINSNYASNPSLLRQEGQNVVANNQQYQAMSRLPQASDQFEYRTCTINRSMQQEDYDISDIIAYDSGTGGLVKTSDDTLRIILGQIGDNYWSGYCDYRTITTNFYIFQPERIKSAVLRNAQFDDWLQVHVVNDGEYEHVWNGPYGNWTDPTALVPGACELNTSWNVNPNVNFTHLLSNIGQTQFRIRAEVAGDGEGYVLGDIEVDTSCKVLPDDIADTCTIYQSNSDCTLLEETADGVKTFSNGYPTGLVPLPSVPSDFCDQSELRDWHSKHRTYRCDSTYQFDFDAAFARADYIQTNSTADFFSDRRIGDDGSISFHSGNLYQLDSSANACTPTCKTRQSGVLNDITLQGTIGQQHHNQKTVRYSYKACGTNNVCPLQDGEEIVKDCQCINEFAESASMMQALRLAGQDLICSNGEKGFPQ